MEKMTISRYGKMSAAPWSALRSTGYAASQHWRIRRTCSTQHSRMTKKLAQEACEFWLVFAEQDELHEQLRPFLPKIVPVLLKGMVYSEMDLLTLGGDEDDAHVADSENDIKPRFHKATTVEIERENKQAIDESEKKKAKGLRKTMMTMMMTKMKTMTTMMMKTMISTTGTSESAVRQRSTCCPHPLRAR